MGIDLSRTGKKILPKVDGRVTIGRRNAERGFPEKLDYFLFTHPTDRVKNMAMVNVEMTKIMTEKYGQKPKTIEVVFPFHHPDEVFYTSFTNWPNKTDWNCKSEDGHIAERKMPDGSCKQVECDYQNCKFRLTKDNKGNPITTCKPIGILSFFILDAPMVGGIWRYTTRGETSINKIQKALDLIYNQRRFELPDGQIVRSLMGLQVQLAVRIEPMMINTLKGKEKQNVPVVSIELPISIKALANGSQTMYGDFKEIMTQAASQGALPNRQIVKELSTSELPPAADEDDDQSPVIDGEIVQTNGQSDDNESLPPEPPAFTKGGDNFF